MASAQQQQAAPQPQASFSALPMNPSSVGRKPIGRKAVGPAPGTQVLTSRPASIAVAPSPSSLQQTPVYATANPQNVQQNPRHSYQQYAPQQMQQAQPVQQLQPLPLFHQTQMPMQNQPAQVAQPTYVAQPSFVAQQNHMAQQNHLTQQNYLSQQQQQFMRASAVPGQQQIAPVQQQMPMPQATPSPTQQGRSPQGTPQLQRVISHASSTASAQSPYSRQASISSSSPGVATPATTVATPSTPMSPTHQSRASGSYFQLCDHCKKGIAENVSVYTCLVCSTGQVATAFCVWCFTTGATALSHPHDKSYYATDSDLRVQLPKSNIPTNIWTIRKNASGRIYYTHNPTGLRTHIKPMAPVKPDDLPTGWAEHRTVEGRTYYFNSTTGGSVWIKPTKSPLPSGWKELRTPDSRPFYVHEELGLSTWERPGEQGKANAASVASGSQATGKGAAAAAGSAAAAAAVGGAVVAKHAKGAAKGANVAAAKTGMDIAINMAKLSNAADLSPAGIMSATVAAAKLTGHGMRFAGKKVGKMGKSSNLKKMGRFINQANALAGGSDCEDDDGVDGDDDDDAEEAEEVEVEQCDDQESVAQTDQSDQSVYQQDSVVDQQQSQMDATQQDVVDQSAYDPATSQDPLVPDSMPAQEQSGYPPPLIEQEPYMVPIQSSEQPTVFDPTMFSPDQQTVDPSQGLGSTESAFAPVSQDLSQVTDPNQSVYAYDPVLSPSTQMSEQVYDPLSYQTQSESLSVPQDVALQPTETTCIVQEQVVVVDDVAVVETNCTVVDSTGGVFVENSQYVAGTGDQNTVLGGNKMIGNNSEGETAQASSDDMVSQQQPLSSIEPSALPTSAPMPPQPDQCVEPAYDFSSFAGPVPSFLYGDSFEGSDPAQTLSAPPLQDSSMPVGEYQPNIGSERAINDLI